jgi:hypothetical protein
MALRQPLSDALRSIKTTAGAVNRGQINLMYLFEPQFLNHFEVTFVPRFVKNAYGASLNTTFQKTSLNPLSSLESASNLPAETAITTFNLQTATIPQISFEYERRQEKRFIKDIIHPDNVIMSFIEEERGDVKAFIAALVKEIVIRNDKGEFIFQDNQEAAKRDAIIKVKSGIGANSIFQPAGWIKLEGLKYESTDEQSFEQGSGDAMILSVTFSVDAAWYISF